MPTSNLFQFPDLLLSSSEAPDAYTSVVVLLAIIEVDAMVAALKIDDVSTVFFLKGPDISVTRRCLYCGVVMRSTGGEVTITMPDVPEAEAPIASILEFPLLVGVLGTALPSVDGIRIIVGLVEIGSALAVADTVSASLNHGG